MGELGIGLYAFSAGNASVEIREYSYFAPPPMPHVLMESAIARLIQRIRG